MKILASLGERDRRALLILAVAASLMIVVRFAVFPALDAGADSSRSAVVREKTLRKYRAMAAAAPARANDAGAVRDALAAAEKGLLSAETAPLAVAEVQQQVRELAAQAQIQLRTVEFLPVKKGASGYSLAPVSAQFTARIDQLVALLAALESGAKTLTVEQLRIVAANQQGGDGLKKLVQVSMVVSGVAGQIKSN